MDEGAGATAEVLKALGTRPVRFSTISAFEGSRRGLTRVVPLASEGSFVYVVHEFYPSSVVRLQGGIRIDIEGNRHSGVRFARLYQII